MDQQTSSTFYRYRFRCHTKTIQNRLMLGPIFFRYYYQQTRNSLSSWIWKSCCINKNVGFDILIKLVFSGVFGFWGLAFRFSAPNCQAFPRLSRATPSPNEIIGQIFKEWFFWCHYEGSWKERYPQTTEIPNTNKDLCSMYF